jgi:hypothetical protein
VKYSVVPKEEDGTNMTQQDAAAVTGAPQDDLKSIPEASIQMCILNEAVAVVTPSISAQ